MLNKIDFKKQLVISLIFAGMSLFLFSIAVFGFLGHYFQGSVFLNYTILSLVIGIYIFGLIQMKFNFAFVLFTAGYVFAFAVFIYNATKDTTAMLETVGLISWWVIMGLVVAMGITFEFLLKSRHDNRALLQKARELEEERKRLESDAIDIDFTTHDKE